MRKVFYSILVFTGAVVFISSCDNGKYVANPNATSTGNPITTKPKDTTVITPPPANGTNGVWTYSKGTFTGKLEDMTPWSAPTASAVIVDSITQAVIGGTDGSIQVLMSTVNFAGVGTYDVTSGTAIMTYNIGSTDYLADSGSFIVSAYVKGTGIQGTYYLRSTIIGLHTVTHGTFNLNVP